MVSHWKNYEKYELDFWKKERRRDVSLELMLWMIQNRSKLQLVTNSWSENGKIFPTKCTKMGWSDVALIRTCVIEIECPNLRTFLVVQPCRLWVVSSLSGWCSWFFWVSDLQTFRLWATFCQWTVFPIGWFYTCKIKTRICSNSNSQIPRQNLQVESFHLGPFKADGKWEVSIFYQ